VSPLAGLFKRHAELLREIASLEEALDAAVAETVKPEPLDETLTLQEAARLMGEPPETFRRRPEYLKARVSRDGERRLRYSRLELDRIRRDRLNQG
jgi:hypothetical protein